MGDFHHMDIRKNDYEKNFNPYEGTDGREYAAYRNYKYAERFDHIGITLNSDMPVTMPFIT